MERLGKVGERGEGENGEGRARLLVVWLVVERFFFF